MFNPYRRLDWPERLLFAIAEHQKGDFAWGQYDCGTLFSDVVFAMTDQDPLEPLGGWLSELSALRCVARSGCDSIKDYLDATLPRIAPSELRRGDAGYANRNAVLSCPAIVVGAEAISRDQTGWIVLPISQLTTAYRIGR